MSPKTEDGIDMLGVEAVGTWPMVTLVVAVAGTQQPPGHAKVLSIESER